MLKAYKYRLYPNKDQKIIFNKTFGCGRFVYKKMLAEPIEIYKKHKDDKARLKVAKLHEKIGNQRKDFLHKLSTQLINENQVIVIEDLKAKNMI